MMKWSRCKKAFHRDGTLRDIYIQNVTEREWDAFLSFVSSSTFKVLYDRGGEPAELPLRSRDVFEDTYALHGLTIDLEGVLLNCHFFTLEEIEMHLDPGDVTSQDALDSVLEFMSGLGGYLSRDVILTEENSREFIWFRYDSRDNGIRYEGIG